VPCEGGDKTHFGRQSPLFFGLPAHPVPATDVLPTSCHTTWGIDHGACGRANLHVDSTPAAGTGGSRRRILAENRVFFSVLIFFHAIFFLEPLHMSHPKHNKSGSLTNKSHDKPKNGLFCGTSDLLGGTSLLLHGTSLLLGRPHRAIFMTVQQAGKNNPQTPDTSGPQIEVEQKFLAFRGWQ